MTPRFARPTPPLQTVDRFNNLFVSAFVTPGGARLLLLHDGRGDDAVRAFFNDVYEVYLRVGCGSCGFVRQLHARSECLWLIHAEGGCLPDCSARCQVASQV